MFELKNDRWVIQVLDPVADADRLGSRYMHGGYIWAVKDIATGADLFSGPCYPDPVPPIFDGQGLPEVFRHSDKDTNEVLMKEGDESLIVGIGKANWTDGLQIAEKVNWEIEQREDVIVFTCSDALAGWSYHLMREVRSDEESIIVATQLESTGEKALNIEWFAHPFFHVDDLNVSMKFHEQMALPAGTRCYQQKKDWVKFDKENWVEGGEFAWLENTPVKTGKPLMAVHDNEKGINFYLHSTPEIARIAFWANEHTVSLEPYMKFDLQPGDRYDWETNYVFLRR